MFLLCGTEPLQLSTVTSHIMAKYENLSCLSKSSPHGRSRWPGPSCKYICNDKLNPIICQAWALRSFHTRALASAWQPSKIIPSPLAWVALKALLKTPVVFKPTPKMLVCFFFSFFSLFSRISLLWDMLSSQHSPRSCVLLNARGARQWFLFQYDKLGLDFLIPQKKNWRVLGLLQKKSQAEIFQVGCRSDPAISAEMFQLWSFGKTWILKPSLGQRQLEAKITFSFPRSARWLIFFSIIFWHRGVFLLNEVDT